MRLDLYLVQEGRCKSRDRAKELIEAGGCLVNGRVVMKPSFLLKDSDVVKLVKKDFAYVSRGGLKLEAALREFGIHVDGFLCVDVGVATGGFTDCLLQQGAKKVCAIDVGKGQLHPSLKQDKRVVFIPDTDIRDADMSLIGAVPDLIVVDVSFISVTLILSALKRLAGSKTVFIFLIKPQYELGEKHAGVIRDNSLIQKILRKVRRAFDDSGFFIDDELESPITGKDGNREFLWHAHL